MTVKDTSREYKFYPASAKSTKLKRLTHKYCIVLLVNHVAIVAAYYNNARMATDAMVAMINAMAVPARVLNDNLAVHMMRGDTQVFTFKLPIPSYDMPYVLLAVDDWHKYKQTKIIL